MPRFPIWIVFILMSAFLTPIHAENWPEFRGPTGQGHYPGKNLPTEWSTDEKRRLERAYSRP